MAAQTSHLREGAEIIWAANSLLSLYLLGIRDRPLIARKFILLSPSIERRGRNSKLLEEFKKFALKGNVLDMAVGVIIGGAFSKIVDSLVADIIMPVIGAITGGLDFSSYYIPLASAVKMGLPYADAKKAGAVLGYGQFITYAVNFLIVAFVLFLVIKQFERLKKAEPAPVEAAPAPTKSEVLLEEIRDALVKK
jgi:large conductance mechanosensitive channel